MDWLAGLSVEWALGVALTLTLVRMGLHLARRAVGPDADRIAGELIESLLFAWVVVFLVVRPLVFQPFSIPSPSMRDTLREGDRIVANEMIYRLHPPQRGDIVVFKSPPAADPRQVDFIKRLIGVPGDTIDIQDGKVWLNGKPLTEPYTSEPVMDPPYTPRRDVPQPPYHVPPGRYFVMGDNRNDSLDSRYWGFLDASRIKGKAVFIFWPPNRMRELRHPDLGSGSG